jgi:hypothetical protein
MFALKIVPAVALREPVTLVKMDSFGMEANVQVAHLKTIVPLVQMQPVASRVLVDIQFQLQEKISALMTLKLL